MSTAQHSRRDRIQASRQFRDGKFRNTSGVGPDLQGGSTMSVMREFFFGGAKRVPRITIPVESPLTAWATPAPTGLRVTWLGHSSLLLEIDGFRALVDPVFGRFAVLLSVIAGVLELLPIIGPIIAAVPAVLLAATAGIESVVAALILYTLVQQIENNFLVPKIQGDATDLHPAAVMFAIIIGGALAGLIGAILALPIAAAGRDVVRYLFRRMSPDDSAEVAALVAKVGATPTDG